MYQCKLAFISGTRDEKKKDMIPQIGQILLFYTVAYIFLASMCFILRSFQGAASFWND